LVTIKSRNRFEMSTTAGSNHANTVPREKNRLKFSLVCLGVEWFVKKVMSPFEDETSAVSGGMDGRNFEPGS